MAIESKNISTQKSTNQRRVVADAAGAFNADKQTAGTIANVITK